MDALGKTNKLTRIQRKITINIPIDIFVSHALPHSLLPMTAHSKERGRTGFEAVVLNVKMAIVPTVADEEVIPLTRRVFLRVVGGELRILSYSS